VSDAADCRSRSSSATNSSSTSAENTTSTTNRKDGSSDTDGQVYGLAELSLLDLARGAVYSSFNLPVRPCSTVRGAASLDWKSRPGNYMQVMASAVLK